MTTLLNTYVHPVLAIFAAPIIALINAFKTRVNDTTNTVVTTVTDTPLHTTHKNTETTKQVSITDEPVAKIFDALEIDSKNKMTPRAFITRIQQVGAISSQSLLNLIRAMGDNDKVMMTVSDIPTKIASWLDSEKDFDGTVLSFLNVINGGSITASIRGAKFLHVAVVDNDKIVLGTKAPYAQFNQSSLNTDVMTYIVFEGNKVAIPVFYTKGYDIVETGMDWTQVTYGTAQYQSINNGLNNGQMDVTVFGLNRAKFDIIDMDYFALIMLRERLATTNQPTLEVDRLISEYETVKTKMKNVLNGRVSVHTTQNFGTIDGGNNVDTPVS